jgi:long-chain fatty acid transport protein
MLKVIAVVRRAKRPSQVSRAVALVAISLLGSRLNADGLSLIDPNARAAGMGGAYVAQASDPTAIFYNPGGLALLKKKKGLSAGVSLSSIRESSFQGLPSGIGAGTTGTQEKKLTTLPYLFSSAPIGGRVVGGVGAYTAYRAHSEWAEPSLFSGRYLATESEIDALDLAPTFAIAITPNFGIGGGAIYRRTTLSASRRIGATLAGNITDVAEISMETDSTSSTGWQAGILFRAGEGFAIGVTHHSAIRVDFEGAGRLTQIMTGNAQLDQLITATFPFGQDLALSSHFDFPAQTTAGIAVGAGPMLFEVDATRANWKDTTAVGFLFPNNPPLSVTYALALKETTSYRGGIRYRFTTGPQLRLGYAVSKSPQPNGTAGPFLADANRNTATLGFGLDWLDVAVGWTTFDPRSVTNNVDQFNGNYRGNAWSAAITVTK